MSKIGISIKIDVTKIDKARLFKGEKGTYLDLTTFIDTAEVDQYGNNGFISQSVSKDERANGVKTPILGNVKVFYGSQGGGSQDAHSEAKSNGYQPQDDFDDDIPF